MNFFLINDQKFNKTSGGQYNPLAMDANFFSNSKLGSTGPGQLIERLYIAVDCEMMDNRK